MKITPEIKKSVPFQYAYGVQNGSIVTGKRIKQAVARFFRWIDEADEAGFVLDHKAGMRIIKFFPTCLNHTVGKMQGQPFHLAAFQQFTLYNLFGWKVKATGLRRITTVYDRRGKKNGKTAEMAGLSLFCMALDNEMGAKNYVGATKEDQAKLCWDQAADFINSPVANPIMRQLGFIVQQKRILFPPTKAVMQPLGGDSKTQDGINAHLAIIDEYHAHADDTVKENLESSNVMRSQPIVYHITTAGANIQSACKKYEDETIIPILEGQAELNHVFAMIHEMDKDDDWLDESNWVKCNPLLGQGYDIDRLREKVAGAQLQPSKAREVKTKNMNMWVDEPSQWIPGEIWAKCKHDLTPKEVAQKFATFGGFAGGDLSTKLDITAYVALSNPDEEGNRYLWPFFFCPKDNIIARSTNDKVPYVAWMDEKRLIATPGNNVDYHIIEAVIYDHYTRNNIARIDFDPWNASALLNNLIDRGINVAELPQNMVNLSEPTKEFEALIYSGRIRHDGNPILAWMISRCVPIYDTKGNMMIRKGDKTQVGSVARIDGIAAAINALAGSMSPEESNESHFNKLNPEDFVF